MTGSSSTRPEHSLSAGSSAEWWGWLFSASAFTLEFVMRIWTAKIQPSVADWSQFRCHILPCWEGCSSSGWVRILFQHSWQSLWSQGCPGADGGFWRAAIPDFWQTLRHRSDLTGKDLTKVEDFQTEKKKKPSRFPDCPWGLQLIYGSETGKMRAGLASAGARGCSRVTIAQKWRLLPTMGDCCSACLTVSLGLLW